MELWFWMAKDFIMPSLEYQEYIKNHEEWKNAFKNGSTKLDWSAYQKNKKENKIK